MRRRVRYSLLSLGVLALACQKKAEVKEAPANFVVTNPLRTDTELVKSYVAQIKAVQHIEVRALERGYL